MFEPPQFGWFMDWLQSIACDLIPPRFGVPPSGGSGERPLGSRLKAELQTQLPDALLVLSNCAPIHRTRPGLICLFDP